MSDVERKFDNTGEYRMEENVCRICGERSINKTYTVKEMMYGTREEFDYFVCSSCNCMQIAKAPENLGDYYSNNYYSFEERERVEFEGEGDMGNRILDVGCGSGRWLLDLAKKGYGELWGCDPFIDADICYGDRVHIKKCDISGMDGKYDFIRFRDSFEHITNPLETLECVKRLLHEDGKCEIHMPVFPNAAWDAFGINWYQLDAPRHIFLHSEKSMKYLCEKCGLKIEKISYNSDAFQFIISYLYKKGIGYIEMWELSNTIFEWNVEKLLAFQKEAAKSNELEYGDHAIFKIIHA